MVFQLRARCRKGRYHSAAGELNQGDSAAKDDSCRRNVLKQIKLMTVRPVVRIAPKPYDHDTINDFRIHQYGRSNIRNRSDRSHIKRPVRSIFHCPLRKICRSRGIHRRFFIRKIPNRASVYLLLQLRSSRKFQNAQNLLIALFHSVRRSI